MVDSGEHSLELTNLRKVYWPASGRTKGDLLRYYASVAPWLLPHLAGRPMVLKRYPGGIDGPHFFMKQAPPRTPSWIPRCRIPHASRTIDYVIVNELAALLWVINLGCIDLNPWPSRHDQPDRPDTLNFDLDPVPGTPFSTIRELALRLRERLTPLGLEPFLKLSGGRGLHLFIPIIRDPSQTDVTHFARQLAQALEQRYPQLVTTAARIAARPPGRVLVDYNQNRWGSTLASVYSVRPTPNATVSTPITWRELEEGAAPGDFTIDTVPERLARRGDLFCPPIAGERCDLTPLLDVTVRNPAQTLLSRLWPPARVRKATPAVLDHGHFHFEVKYDGFRAIAASVGGDVILRSRNGLDLGATHPDLLEALRTVRGDWTLDGELLEDRYVAFDLLWSHGVDRRDEPIEARQRALQNLLASPHAPSIERARSLPAPFPRAWAEVRRHRLEGVIAKPWKSPYPRGDLPCWLKLPRLQRDEFRLVGYTRLAHANDAIGALLLAHEGHYAGRVGTGFTDDERRSLHSLLARERSLVPPLPVPISQRELTGVSWLHPRHWVEIEFSARTRDGRLRHPRFIRLRPDKETGGR